MYEPQQRQATPTSDEPYVRTGKITDYFRRQVRSKYLCGFSNQTDL